MEESEQERGEVHCKFGQVLLYSNRVAAVTCLLRMQIVFSNSSEVSEVCVLPRKCVRLCQQSYEKVEIAVVKPMGLSPRSAVLSRRCLFHLFFRRCLCRSLDAIWDLLVFLGRLRSPSKQGIGLYHRPYCQE